MKPRSCLIGPVVLWVAACGTESSRRQTVEGGVERDAGASHEVTPAPEGKPHPTLEEWHLFSDAPTQVPQARVNPYEVISPLFADYAFKKRFLFVPKGKTIGYDPEGIWDFPVGTILVKTFYYPTDFREPEGERRLLETRLLVRESGRWATHTYVWDEDQAEARRKVAGASIPVDFIDESGDDRTSQYNVPNTNECLECHGDVDVTNSLGGRTRQLDRDYEYGGGPENQIDHFADLGLFEGAPEPSEERERLVDPFGDEPLDIRARSYLDSNCGSCHDETGEGSTGSGLKLDWGSTDPESEDPANWGVCKIPTSAGGATCGLTYDVVPGEPDRSIFLCRVTSEETEVRMPPLGRNLEHVEGVELVRQWIASMSGMCE